ncbi:MAG: hypothetical protein R3Y53_10020 [Bacillota bacterium]
MRKYFEIAPSFEDLKNKVVVIDKRDNNKTLFVMGTIIAATLALVTLGVVFLLKNKLDQFDDEWDYDWDELDEEFDDMHACSDDDIDDSVVVEEI